jgi:hypothetical protein
MEDEVDVAVRGPVSARHNRDGTEVAMDGLYDDVPCCLASPAAQEHCARMKLSIGTLPRFAVLAASFGVLYRRPWP